jgi:hypothetical protein
MDAQGTNIHVNPEGSRWLVVRGGNVLAMHDTQQDAIEDGRRLATEAGVDLVIRDEVGDVQHVFVES